MPLLFWLIALFIDNANAGKRERDQFFAHRAWEEGRMTDAEYWRKGGDLGRRFVAEKKARQAFRAPPAQGFRSRPFA